jgi:two-component system chemotaxis sensor kinase CheA
MRPMSTDLNPLLQQFIPEARDLLEQAGRSLLALEREPGGAEPMNALFRAVHTLKGTSGLFDILPLTRVVHAAEDLLDAVQGGRLTLLAETADVLLDALDQVGVWIDGLAEAGVLPAAAEAASGTWVDRLRAPLANADSAGAPASVAAVAAGLPAVLRGDVRRGCRPPAGDQLRAGRALLLPRRGPARADAPDRRAPPAAGRTGDTMA